MTIASPVRGFDRVAIESHVELLHDLAAGCEGVLILAGFEEGGASVVQRFKIGDVDGMVSTIMAYENHPKVNLYTPWCVMRPDLAPGKKGGEADVVAVLAGVPDLDHDKYTLGELPIEAPYIVESSPGNFQPVYPFSRPLQVSEAKPALTALSNFIGGDSGTKDASHVWRIPGTLNIPTKSKLARGRSPVPQRVTIKKNFDGRFIEPDILVALAPQKPTGKPNGHDSSQSAAVDARLRDALTAIPADDRNVWAPIGMALHTIGARAIWEDWAKTSNKFDALGQDKAWASFKRERDGPVVTVATIFKLARDRGWKPSHDDALAQEPLPLFSPLPPSQPYPVKALGDAMSRAAGAIARKIQVPLAMAAQSVLAVASLAVQGHANVMLPMPEQSRPTTLFLFCVMESGNRKTSCDNEALWPVARREKILHEVYDDEIESWNIEHSAWAAEKRKIEGDRKIGKPARKAQLTALGKEPERPLSPFLTTGDLTLEGLVKHWGDARPSLGIFTPEGSTFTAGHGMNDDNRLRTAATLSDLWDGKTINRVRASDPLGAPIIRVGKRLALHIMIQPGAAAGFLSDRRLRDQGLLSRILLVAPESLAGTRKYRAPDPKDNAAITAYGARILSLLETPLPIRPGTRNDLDPPVLHMSPAALPKWIDFYNRAEERLAPLGDCKVVQDFAAKAAEQAVRIAGCITIVENIHATAISDQAVAGAITMMEFYLNETLRLREASQTNPDLLIAAALLDWLQKQPGGQALFSDIMRLSPKATRTKAAADKACSILKDHSLVTEISVRPRIIKARKA